MIPNPILDENSRAEPIKAEVKGHVLGPVLMCGLPALEPSAPSLQKG